MEEDRQGRRILERSKIPIEKIDFNDTKYQYRLDFPDTEIEKLSESIRKTGQLNPVKVRRKGTLFQIIAGWERAYAVRKLNDRPLIADVYDDLSDEQALMINVADNVMRTELSDLELAYQVSAFRKMDISVTEIAEIYGCNTYRVYDLLTLTRVRPEIQDAVHKGEIMLYHAIELNKYPVENQIEYLGHVVKEKKSVRWLEQELAAIKRHPFRGFISERTLKRLDGAVHAVKFAKTPSNVTLWKRHWELFGKYRDIPAPLMCEATASIPARSMKPPFVCHNEIEWVVLKWGIIIKQIRRDPKQLQLPLAKRDGWLYLCTRCAKTMFPNCIFHYDIVHNIMNDDEITKGVQFNTLQEK